MTINELTQVRSVAQWLLKEYPRMDKDVVMEIAIQTINNDSNSS